MCTQAYSAYFILKNYNLLVEKKINSIFKNPFLTNILLLFYLTTHFIYSKTIILSITKIVKPTKHYNYIFSSEIFLERANNISAKYLASENTNTLLIEKFGRMVDRATSPRRINCHGILERFAFSGIPRPPRKLFYVTRP